MGLTKHEIYTQKQIEFAKFFKALGHPARIAILEKLVENENKAMSTDELLGELDLAQSTKSVHLKKLTEIGILSSRTTSKGNKSCLSYKINKEALQYIQNYIKFSNSSIPHQITDEFIVEYYSLFYPNFNFDTLNLT